MSSEYRKQDLLGVEARFEYVGQGSEYSKLFHAAAKYVDVLVTPVDGETRPARLFGSKLQDDFAGMAVGDSLFGRIQHTGKWYFIERAVTA